MIAVWLFIEEKVLDYTKGCTMATNNFKIYLKYGEQGVNPYRLRGSKALCIRYLQIASKYFGTSDLIVQKFFG